jgi:transketolase
MSMEHAASYGEILVEVGEAFPSTVVLDAGLGSSMQTSAFAQRFPERYVNLGIAEQNAVSIASGLARRGLVPLVHSFSNFLARRALDQIAVSVAWPATNVKLIAGSCGIFDGRNGPSHMASDDLSTIVSLPGVSVMEPADTRQTRSLLSRAVSADGPVYFRLRRHGMSTDLADGHDPCEGTLLLQSEERAVATVIAAGVMLEEVLETSRILARHDLLIDLLHVAVLRPLSTQKIITSACKTRLVVVIENHRVSTGLGSLVGHALEPLGIRLHRMGLPDEFLPAGDPDWLSRYCLLDAESIAVRIAQLLEET